MDGLNIKASLYKSRYMNDYSRWDDPRAMAGENNAAYNASGYGIRENRKWDRELMEWTANYDKTFNDVHKINAVAGYSWEKNTYSNAYAGVHNFAVYSMGANSLQAGNSLDIGNITSSKNEYKLISFFGRASYSYKEKYMVLAKVSGTSCDRYCSIRSAQ